MGRFNIGDKVYVANFERKAITVPCPDCFGSKRLRVILGDDTELSIECAGCNPGGFEPPRGYITNYVWTASADCLTITGIGESLERDGQIKYRYNFPNRCDDRGRTFATIEEALAKADELKQSYEEEENRRMMAKTKDKRSWAWNVTYHRQCAARAQKELEYHQAKATICAAKVKHEQT